MSSPKSPFHIADYRFFWLARFASGLATSGMVIIIGYQLYDVARNAYGLSVAQASFQLGLLGFFQFAPMFVLTPVSGLVADRFDRRHIGALALAVDFIVAIVLAISTAAGWHSLPLLFAMGVLHGIARVFAMPAISALAPNVVPVDLLPRAIALNSMAMQAGSIGGPALAGVLFGLSRPLPYEASLLMLGGAVAALLMIRRQPAISPEMRKAHPLRQIAEGFSYVRTNRFLLGCITLDLFAVLLAGATALLPVYARDILHVGPTGLGEMRAAPAMGAALVGLWLSARPLEHNVGTKMLVAVAIFGAVTVVFGVSTHYALSLLMLGLLGAADMVSVFVRSSLVQLKTPDDKRGRVSAISSLAISASNELGEMESGLAASLLGPVGAVVLGGVGAIVVTLTWAVIFPEIRRARRFSVEDDDAAPTAGPAQLAAAVEEDEERRLT